MKIPKGWFKLHPNQILREGDKFYSSTLGKWETVFPWWGERAFIFLNQGTILIRKIKKGK